jgi:hypothetical protein
MAFFRMWEKPRKKKGLAPDTDSIETEQPDTQNLAQSSQFQFLITLAQASRPTRHA